MDQVQREIAIIGCGWLGVPLGRRLLERGMRVKGSRTSPKGCQLLQENEIDPYQVCITPEGLEGDFKGLLDAVDTAVIAFPPGLRKDPSLDYCGAVEKLGAVLEASGVQKVLYTSSTAVYGDTSDFRHYTEASDPNTKTLSGRQIRCAEKILLGQFSFRTIIVRFGGLIGPDRHPVFTLAGRSGLKNPDAPVNLIHQEDCIRILSLLIEENGPHGVYNGVYPIYPSRRDYYVNKAKEYGLSAPKFETSQPSLGKVVSASKVVREYQFNFSIQP